MEKLVIDLEYAKKLKEVGIIEDSRFNYGKPVIDYNISTGEYIYSDSDSLLDYTSGIRFGVDKDVYSAYLTEELIQILPTKIFNNDTLAYGLVMSTSRDSTKDFIAGYYRYNMQDCYIEARDNKLSNALAKLLIELREKEE